MTSRTLRASVKLQFIEFWSRRRGSNPQHSEWKSDTLPIELLRHTGALNRAVVCRIRCSVWSTNCGK